MHTLIAVTMPAWLTDGMAMLLTRLGLDLVFTTIAVRLVYYRLYKSRDYVFTYFLINIVTFTIAHLLSNVRIELGFALGLFAVFGILRYRTEAIKVRDLTYLFVVIGIALLHALAGDGIALDELLIANGAIVGTVALLEVVPFSGREESRVVHYDRLDLLSPESSAALLEDLRRRTHVPVERCEIGNVDLPRDSADNTNHYRPKHDCTEATQNPQRLLLWSETA
jgi:membrane associated rhomboid family serine protease